MNASPEAVASTEEITLEEGMSFTLEEVTITIESIDKDRDEVLLKYQQDDKEDSGIKKLAEVRQMIAESKAEAIT